MGVSGGHVPPGAGQAEEQDPDQGRESEADRSAGQVRAEHAGGGGGGGFRRPPRALHLPERADHQGSGKLAGRHTGWCFVLSIFEVY